VNHEQKQKADETRADKRRRERAANRGRRALAPLEDPGWREVAIKFAIMAEFDRDEYPTAEVMVILLSPFPLLVGSIDLDGRRWLNIEARSRAADVKTAVETFVTRTRRVWERCKFDEKIKVLDAVVSVRMIIRGLRFNNELMIKTALGELVAMGWLDLLRHFVDRARSISTSNLPPAASAPSQRTALLLKLVGQAITSREKQLHNAISDLAAEIMQDGGLPRKLTDKK
jgi:hypothetical protein